LTWDASFFARNAIDVASDLVGFELQVSGVGGVIVETEAYLHNDAASHSFAGATKRNQSMFGPPAYSYVYLSYGLHWCLNFVCLPGSAVLIRAIEPKWGLGAMQTRRRVTDPKALCSGPGRIGQALAITREHDGLPLRDPPFRLRFCEKPSALASGTRVGITRAIEQPWRFGLKGSPFLSRKF
jgi:DNA-3-methyladenine glycosylase